MHLNLFHDTENWSFGYYISHKSQATQYQYDLSGFLKSLFPKTKMSFIIFIKYTNNPIQKYILSLRMLSPVNNFI